MQVIEFNCPSCGNDMVFDSETGKLSCRSCGRKEDIENLPDPLEEKTFSEDETKEYHCNSCGAVIMTEEETTATTCSFCGAGVILGDRLTGKLAPAKVIPFSIGKEEATKAFRKWCKNGLLTPNGFMTADRIKGLTGMYVPFWLYDLNNKIEVHANGTKVSIYTSGEYRVTETMYFQVYRDIVLNYVRVPMDASKKMNDELMDKLEPFHYDQLKRFKSPYLAGYIAEKYNYNEEELLPRVKDKISKYVDSYIQSALTEYSTVNYTSKKMDTKLEQADYVLIPVWMVHYNYNKLEYTFAMNGQTGKVVGKPPISNPKVIGWFAGIFGVSFISLKLISWMMGGGLW